MIEAAQNTLVRLSTIMSLRVGRQICQAGLRSTHSSERSVNASRKGRSFLVRLFLLCVSYSPTRCASPSLLSSLACPSSSRAAKTRTSFAGIARSRDVALTRGRTASPTRPNLVMRASSSLHAVDLIHAEPANSCPLNAAGQSAGSLNLIPTSPDGYLRCDYPDGTACAYSGDTGSTDQLAGVSYDGGWCVQYAAAFTLAAARSCPRRRRPSVTPAVQAWSTASISR